MSGGGRRKGTGSQKRRCLEWLQAVAREDVREGASRRVSLSEELKHIVGILHLKR